MEEEEVVVMIIISEPYNFHSIFGGDLCSSWCLNAYLKSDIISILTIVNHHEAKIQNPYSGV